MLRNIPSSELADIISGNSPNPILETPTTDILNETEALPHSPEGVPMYQHSLHSLLRKQLSNKRKPMRDRRSLPNIDGRSSQQEADKDVIEMNLDSEPTHTDHSPISFITRENEEENLKSGPVYPAMLLNESQSKDAHHMPPSPNLQSRTSVPDMMSWDNGHHDYFSNEPIPSSAASK